MSILLLRLDGPMQAWGVQSRYGIRDSGREPSKSGVIGLLCAALGRSRNANIEDLAAMKMGVRVDAEGSLLSDFQTIQTLDLKGQGKKTQISTRYYLSGAIFLAAFEGDSNLIQLLVKAIQQPVWPLYLGRKAFPPSMPVALPESVFDDLDLLSALASYPFLGRHKKPDQLRVVFDDPQGEITRPDHPISFEPRVFAERRVKQIFIPSPKENLQEAN